jgi:formate dehydrogenase iron-sulfur subunit
VLGGVVAAAGVTGVVCSALLYGRTRRRWWRTPSTLFRFGMTTAVFAYAVAAWTSTDIRLAQIGAALAVGKVLWELLVLRHLRAPADDDLHKTAALLSGALRMWFVGRVALTLGGAAVLLVSPILAVPLLLAGELLERRLFFTAVAAPRMPGVS